MKRIVGVLIVAMFLSGGLVTSALAGDEGAQFVFAPAPITDPVAPGEKSGRFTFSYINIDSTPEFSLYGFNLTGREDGNSKTLNFMIGSDEDDTTDLLSLNGGINLEGSRDPMSIPFFGLTLGVTSVTSDFADTFLATYGLLGGYQHHIEIQPNVYVTPYITYGWQYFNGYVDVAGNPDLIDIDGSTTTLTLGFDISFSGLSLATLFQSGEDNVTQFHIGFGF